MRTPWNDNWDWRPLTRLIVWGMIAAAFMPPLDYRAIAREIVLGWLVTFGFLTWLQALLASGTLLLYLKLDKLTYAASERIVGPFGGGFLPALAVQLCLILCSIAGGQLFRR